MNGLESGCGKAGGSDQCLAATQSAGTIMIVVHHLEHSRSQRVLWMLEELGLAYEVRRYRRDPETMLAPASLRAVHILGKSPVVTEGEQVFAESGAIIEHLAERNPAAGLAPAPDDPQRFRYLYWLHFAEGSAMTPLFLKLIIDRLEGSRAPFIVRPVIRSITGRMRRTLVTPRLEDNLDFMEAELARSAWFAGDRFTAADIQMSFPVQAALARGGSVKALPHLRSFAERIESRPSYKRALERGGKFEILR